MESQPLVELNDAALAVAWTTGDERAFDAIVARHTPRIFNRCRLALGVADADDATQAVFLVLARKGAQAAASPVLAAWLMQVAGNVVRNAVRDRGRRRNAERQAPPPPPAGEPTMSDIAVHLDACLADLPAAEREAVSLHHLAGCTLAEVGAQTGVGTSTVHARVRRGLERLRALLTRRGVALSSLALVAALASEAQVAVPAAVLVHLRDLTHAGGGTGSTAIPSDRAKRWSRARTSTMTRIAVAAAGFLLIGGAALHFLSSAETLAGAAPVLGARPAADTPRATAPAAPVASPKPDWAILRIGDGASILAGLRRQPELALLGNQSLLDELDSLRDAGFAVRVGYTAPPGVTADPAMPKQHSLDFIGSIRCAAADAPLLHRLRAGADGANAWFGMRASGSGWRYWTTSGQATMTITDDHVDFAPPSALAVAPPIAALAAGSPEAGLIADFCGMAGPLRFLHGGLRWADDGLHLHLENLSAADAARAGYAAKEPPIAAPVLDRQLLEDIPASAIWAAAVATRPGSGTVDPLVTQTLMYFQPTRVNGRLVWPPAQQAVERWIKRTDGTLLAWIEPDAPIPHLTLQIAMSEAEAATGLRDCGLALAADGSAMVPAGPLMLSVGWRAGALLLTTSPAGIDAVDRRGGFAGHPEVRRALAALPVHPITACTIIRSAAVLDTLAPYLAMIDSGTPQPALRDYRARLAATEAFSLVSAGAVDGRLVIDARGSVLLAGCVYLAGHADQIARMLQIAN